jgi:hypothetical protein
MDPTTHIESADQKIEGVQIGAYVVLFGRNGSVSGGTSYAYSAATGAITTHYISDLSPGTTYALTGADEASATASAQGVLSFTSTGTGVSAVISVAPE